jgi:hypothetical protein
MLDVFLWMKHASTQVDTLIVKTVECGVLKILMQCVGMPCDLQRFALVCSVLKNCGTIVL